MGEPAAAPLLEARALVRSYDAGRVRAVRGVSLAVAPGEFVAVTGPSGSGKSTLLYLLGGLDEPDSGEVLFAGRRPAGRAAWCALRGREIGFVFQSFHLLPALTALENVQVPLLPRQRGAARRRERARGLLAEVGLAARGDHLPGELSAGERQRVALARSLVNEPRLLLADEPTGNLDQASAREVLELLERLRAARGATLVIVTHDADVAARAGRVLRLVDGRLAPPAEGG